MHECCVLSSKEIHSCHRDPISLNRSGKLDVLSGVRTKYPSIFEFVGFCSLWPWGMGMSWLLAIPIYSKIGKVGRSRTATSRAGFSSQWVGALSGPRARDVSRLPAILTSLKTEKKCARGLSSVRSSFSLIFRRKRTGAYPVNHSWFSLDDGVHSPLSLAPTEEVSIICFA